MAMMPRKTKKTGPARGTQRWMAGILGVTPEHLNRVINGHLLSRSLSARVEALKQEEAKRMSQEIKPRFDPGAAPEASAAGNSLDPAAANTCIEWLDVAGKVGFTVVAVVAPYSEELWAVSGFEKTLGRELNEAGLGHYDSAKWFNPIAFFFYVSTQRLAVGLQTIKQRLGEIGLLSRVKIATADPETKTWRIFWPEADKAGL